jgi:hypothetical protein
VINASELRYCDRGSDCSQRRASAGTPSHRPSDRLAVVLDKDIGQRPLGDVGVAVIWPPVQNRSLGEPIPSQNLLVLANVLHLPM